MSIFVGNAPCSWGTLEFDGTGGERFTYHQMLDELVATGYTGSELGDWGFMPTEPEPLAEEFAKRQLALTGAFVGVALRDPTAHEAGEARVLQTAKLLAAARHCSMTWIVLRSASGMSTIRIVILTYSSAPVPGTGITSKQCARGSFVSWDRVVWTSR